MQGVADEAIPALAEPHWQALSVMLQPAPVMAVCKQSSEQDGSMAVRSEMDWAWAIAARMAVTAVYVNFIFAVDWKLTTNVLGDLWG